MQRVAGDRAIRACLPCAPRSCATLHPVYARSVSDGSVAISKGAVSSCRGDSPIVPGIAGPRALPAFAELSNEPLLGRGLRLRPAYNGSASRHTELVPVVRYFGEPWFARSTQGVLEGGARVEPGWSLRQGYMPAVKLPTNPGARRANPWYIEPW